MAISLANLQKKSASTAPIAVIYGVPGVGRTSLAAEFPSSVFLQIGDGENAPSGVEITAFGEIKQFEDVMGAVAALYQEEHDFKTAVIDSLGALEPVIQREACRRNNWTTIEDPGFGKGYVAAESVWMEYIDGISALRRDKGMNIVQIAHCGIIRFDSPTTDPYSRYRINLHKRAADRIEASADLIAFLNYKVAIKKADVGFDKKISHGEGGGVRFIHVEERPGFIAKNRYDMPPEIQYRRGEGFNALAKYLPGSAAAA